MLGPQAFTSLMLKSMLFVGTAGDGAHDSACQAGTVGSTVPTGLQPHHRNL